VQTARIAREAAVPKMYLRKIIQTLSHAGFVHTIAGARGGVILSADPAKISLKDIIETVEGALVVSECIDHPDACRNSPSCKVRRNLAAIQECLRREFSSRRISDFI